MSFKEQLGNKVWPVLHLIATHDQACLGLRQVIREEYPCEDCRDNFLLNEAQADESLLSQPDVTPSHWWFVLHNQVNKSLHRSLLTKLQYNHLVEQCAFGTKQDYLMLHTKYCNPTTHCWYPKLQIFLQKTAQRIQHPMRPFIRRCKPIK